MTVCHTNSVLGINQLKFSLTKLIGKSMVKIIYIYIINRQIYNHKYLIH